MKKRMIFTACLFSILLCIVGCTANPDKDAGSVSTTTSFADSTSTTITTGGTADDGTAGATTTAKPLVSTTVTATIKTTAIPATTTTVTTTTTKVTVPYPHVALNDPALKYTGRSLVVPGEVWLDWSASGVELMVTGGSVEAQLYAVDLGDTQRVYMAVYVNGERTKTFPLENGITWYTLADSLPEDKVSTVKLVRLTEASTGKATLFDLKVTGKALTRPANKPHRIEWIGDSLTCGYGILGNSASDPFLASTEDVTKTYAWLCSEALNAEMSVVAASGYGAGSNWAGKQEQLIPDVFPYYNSISRDAATPWDYSLYQPELVVINLGTNDFNGCSGSGTGAIRIKSGAKKLLTMLRAAYPKATICWVYGLCHDGYGQMIRQTVEQFAATDGNAAYISVSVQNATKNGYGSVWHPNAKSNSDCAAELLPKLRELMKW